MNYFNKLVSNVTNAPNQEEQLRSDLKKREAFISKLQEKLKTATQQKQFVTASYEELQKKYELLSNTKNQENGEFIKNVEAFAGHLQNYPQELLDALIASLLQKLNEHVGQWLDPQEIKSVLDIDFNYKHIFADHISKVHELTKQALKQELAQRTQNLSLQGRLQLKNREVEELVGRYEASVEQLKTQHSLRISNKLQEFNVVKEQKDLLIRDLSESLKLKVQENEALLQANTKLRQSEGQLKVQKDKIEAKFSELCQNNRDLHSKNKEKEAQLQAASTANHRMLAELADEKNSLLAQLAQMTATTKLLQDGLREAADKAKESQGRAGQLKKKVLADFSKINLSSIRQDCAQLKQDLLNFKQANLHQANQEQLYSFLDQYFQKLEGSISHQNQQNLKQREQLSANQDSFAINQQIGDLRQLLDAEKLKNQQLQSSTAALLGTIEELQALNGRMKQQFSQQQSQLSDQLSHYESQMNRLTSQISACKDKLRQAQSDFQQNSRRLAQQTQSSQQKIKELQDSLFRLAEQGELLQMQNKQKSEKLQMQRLYQQAKLQLEESRDNYAIVSSQYQNQARNSQQLKEQLEESLRSTQILQLQIQELKRANEAAQKQLQNSRALLQQNKQTIQEYKQTIQEQNAKYESKIKKSEDKIELAETQSYDLRREFEKKEQLISSKLQELIVQHAQKEVQLNQLSKANLQLVQQQQHQLVLQQQQHQQLRQQQQQHQQLRQQQQQHQQLRQQLRWQLDSSQAKLVQKEQELQATLSQLQQKHQQYQLLESKVEILKQAQQKQLIQAEQNSYNLRRQLQDLQSQAEEKERSLEQNRVALITMEQRIKILKENLNNQPEEASNNSLQLLSQLQEKYKMELGQKQEKLSAAQSANKELNNKIIQLGSVIQTKERQIQVLQQGNSQHQLNLAQLGKEKVSLQRQIFDISDSLRALTKETQYLSIERNRILDEMQAIEANLDNARQQKLKLEQQKHYLEQTTRRYSQQIDEYNLNKQQSKEQLEQFALRVETLQLTICQLQKKAKGLEQQLLRQQELFECRARELFDQNQTLKTQKANYCQREKDVSQILKQNEREISSTIHKLQETQFKSSELSNEVEHLNNQIRLLQSQKETASRQLEQLQQEKERAELDAEDYQKRYNETNFYAQKYQAQVDEYKLAVSQKDEAVTQKQDIIAELETQLLELQVKMDQIATTSQAGSQVVAAKLQQLQRRVVEMATEVQTQRDQNEQLVNIQHTISQKLEKAQLQLDAKVSQLAVSQDKIQALNKEIEVKMQQFQRLQAEQQQQNRQKNKEINDLLSKVAELNDKMSQCIQNNERQADQLKKQLNQATEELKILDNNYEQLRITNQQLSNINKILEETKFQQSELILIEQLNNQKLKTQLQDRINQLQSFLRQENQALQDHKQSALIEKQHITKQHLQQKLNQQREISQLRQANHLLQSTAKQLQLKWYEQKQQAAQLRQKTREIQQNLANQILLKNQAIEDLQIISQFTKDYESREAQLTNKQQSMTQLELIATFFNDTFHKDFNQESISFIKNAIDMMKQEIRLNKDQNQRILKQYQDKYDKKSQEVLQATKISQHFQSRFNQANSQKQRAEAALLIKDAEKVEFQKQEKQRQIQLLNTLNKSQEAHEKIKLQLQKYQSKFSKKESEISKLTQSISSLQSKQAFLKTSLEQKQGQVNSKDLALATLRKQIQNLKSKINQEVKSKAIERDDHEKQILRVRAQLQKINSQNALLIRRQYSSKDQAFKNQKLQLEQKQMAEAKKLKEQTETVKREKQEIEREMANTKANLLEQKKISSRLLAELNDAKANLGKSQSLKNSNNDFQQKLLLKDQEIKRGFAQIQSLKNTMSEMDEGIQTYQSMAQDAQRQIQLQKQKNQILMLENKRLGDQLQALSKKMSSSKFDSKVQQARISNTFAQSNLHKKEQIISHIKMLFLKYFEPTSTYQNKLRAFDTLCEALSLSVKQSETMSVYRRTKLARQAELKKERTQFGSKFLDYLSSQK